ncbi:PufQ cytochrome subunit [Roseivivax jejudonensis]|uniref:PufQ cytochrome subunit n=1 Tax=Roseivivax jejudonensis TaxID=1529041 RepID=A0A1X6ZPH4_9RHOB|nr:cytochrome PufQ [Roseivivax jejudonensis]SLN57292.1 PufQ cytochrome subunit [Roseivivax jejudonensis]
MTDFTTDMPRRRVNKRGAEFLVYFSLIFVLAIPFATGSWLLDVFRKQTLNLHGPLARAWAEADRITPILFSA